MSMLEFPHGDFYHRTRTARKVMVLDLGFLGDVVHLLPELWLVRQAYPNAQLHVAVASHVTSLLACVPWVDRSWGYMRYPRHATWRENVAMIRALRREKFDVLINLNGSDRSSWLTWLSGAHERLGREPNRGVPFLWRWMYTARVREERGREPVYLQGCRCLAQAGFPFERPEFQVNVNAASLAAAGIQPADYKGYFHLSPFTTADRKELAPAQLAELIRALGETFPGKKLVLSCAPDQRELHKMETLLALLPRKPWRVFAGTLNLLQLAAVIQHSALHFCGDTGTLHLAVMTNTPTVTWFWPNPVRNEWLPVGETHRSLLGVNPPGEPHLSGISTSGLVAAAQSILHPA